MQSSAGCVRPRLAALVIVTSLLSACATVGSETGGLAVCSPVFEYSQEFRTRAVEELALLPEATAIAEMLGDYSVMRDQARACRL